MSEKKKRQSKRPHYLQDEHMEKTNQRKRSPKVERPKGKTVHPEQTTYQIQQTTYQPQHTTYQPQQTIYHPQQTIYHPQQTIYHPQQTIYQPQQTIYQFQQTTYQPQQTIYQPQTAYQVEQTTYQHQQSAYQPQQSTYQPQQTIYQLQQTNYQPQQTAYQVEQTTYQPEETINQPEETINQPEETINQPEETSDEDGTQPLIMYLKNGELKKAIAKHCKILETTNRHMPSLMNEVFAQTDEILMSQGPDALLAGAESLPTGLMEIPCEGGTKMVILEDFDWKSCKLLVPHSFFSCKKKGEESNEPPVEEAIVETYTSCLRTSTDLLLFPDDKKADFEVIVPGVRAGVILSDDHLNVIVDSTVLVEEVPPVVEPPEQNINDSYDQELNNFPSTSGGISSFFSEEDKFFF